MNSAGQLYQPEDSMRRCPIRIFTAALMLLLTYAAPSFADDTARYVIRSDNSDYFGFDLRAEKEVTLDQCEAICLQDNQCRAFTYNISAQWCFLKSDYGRLEPFEGAIAGRIETTNAADDIGAPATLSFVPAYIVDEARQFAIKLTRQTGTTGQSLRALTGMAGNAIAAGDPRRAMDLYAASIHLAPEETKTWAGLANAALTVEPANNDDNYQLPQYATSSAFNAYLTSRTVPARANALALLAAALERRNMSRPALEAYKASLALENSASVQAAYKDLRARKGFRVVDHTVDSDSSTPRICVQFSETLIKTGLDYASYISVDGASPKAVDAKDKQICVEGLRHGQRYRIALRDGLPAAIGEGLEQPVALNVYVRDRSATARFTGDNFVLPSTARRGIPLVTVNSNSANLKLYRVGERALTQLLTGSQFLRQLDGYSASRITDDLGIPIWDGTLDIETELNKDVVTSIPVDELVPDMQPGVYVLTARPEGDRRNSWETQATQWFVVSDIGLTTYAGEDGLHVFARALSNAKPMAGIDLQLLARNNEILGTATTDETGQAAFTAGLTRGENAMAPAIIMANGPEGDFVFLDLTRAGFDLSDRGVTGRPAPGAFDVYVWTERGIYRAGETVHVAALARDTSANAVSDLPLTFIFKRPDGVEERRFVSNGAALGGHTVDLDLLSNAMRGTWQVRVHTDPKAEPVAEQMFLVEDFVPDRIEFDLTSDAERLAIGDTASVTVDGRYLYGAPATGLALEGEINLTSVRTWDGFDGFVFGLADEEKAASRISLNALPILNSNGKSTFDVRLDDTPSTTQLLNADVTVRLRESGGRAVERKLDIPVAADDTMLGIRADFKNGQVGEGATASFDVIALDPAGNRQAAPNLRWSLVKVERQYQWYRNGNSWNYEPVTYTRQIADGMVDTSPEETGKIAVQTDWGRYRLEVETANAGGPITSIEFNAGWYVEASSTETPDGLEIALDQASYKPGDTARLTISPRFAGELLVTIGADNLLETKMVSVPEEGSTIEIPVGDNWGAGAYVTATLFRPGTAQESRMPMRAIGIKWLQIDPGARKLDVSLDLPEKTQPRQSLDVPIRIAGLPAGQDAYVTIAVVDVGILNLTRYEAPAPDAWYYGQRQLGLELRDLYGRLIDGSLGATGRIRSGGDGPGMTADGSPPTEELVAFFAGPVRVGDDGTAVANFDIPQFNGTARVMAVAWTRDAVGHATSDIIIRDPVVVTASMPKFLAPGDQSQLRLDLANTDGPAGIYTLDFVASNGVTMAETGIPGTVDLAAGAKRSLVLPLNGAQAGDGSITVVLSHAEGLQIAQTVQIPVRPSSMPITTRQVLTLAAQSGSVILDEDFLAGRIVNAASVSIGVSRGVDFDVPALLLSLDRYPYGCAEQTTSRALPLLYLSEMAAASGMAEDPSIRERVQKAINRTLSNQSYSGGFGLWSPGSGDLWLDAYVTDFLTRAREQKYDVPEQAMMQALENLQNTLAYTTDIKESGSEIAYALYVLARNRRASAGDLRYYADTQMDAFASPMARAHIAAGIALYGDPVRAESAFSAALRLASGDEQIPMSRADYGSPLRDSAAMLALAAETRPVPSLVDDMVDLVAASRLTDQSTSTQEAAWMLLAARAIKAGDASIALQVDGEQHNGAFARLMSGPDLLNNPITITNQGDEPLDAIITIIAPPKAPLPAGGNGFSIERTYFHLDGNQANVTEAKQNERYVVVIRVIEDNAWPSRIIVNDLLPAGFEIDNPRLVGSAELSNFTWLGQTNAAHTEFRHDRFVAAFDRHSNNPRELTMAYVVRAVTPGRYVHPAASVEDMYRPQFSARTASGLMEVRAAGE